jgi:lipopolysaccharide/colanic/teichoic acid biosynthesis glycosyltransferase/glycosyltransferase involved in cell wall biosynthesis
MTVAAAGHRRGRGLAKRVIDLIVAVIALVVTLPVQAAVAIAVRRKLGSPVLFRQVRPGLGGRPFTMVKFRTMLDRDPAARLETDEQRLTPFGGWLRSTSLDELPELWNVLRGEMSLVGPRPLLTEYLPVYTAEQARRHEVRPGLTGLAQVNGRNQTTWDKRLALDVEYVDRQSLGLDLRILRQTFRQVLDRDAASADGHATMPLLTQSAADSQGRGLDVATGARVGTPAAPVADTMELDRTAGRGRTLVYGVTVGQTADLLLKGQLSYLRERGWTVHLVCSPGAGADRASAREGVDLHPLPMTRGINPVADARALLQWIALLRRIRPAAVNVGTPKAGFVGSVAAWLTRVPVRVYVVRGLRLETETGLKRWLLWFMEKVTILASTSVVVVSESLRDELAAARLARPDHTVLIGSGSSNGVDAAGIRQRVESQDRKVIREGFGISPEQPTVGYIGRLSVDKGLADLAEALAEPAAAGLHLVTMGEVEDDACLASLGRLGARWHQVPADTDISPVLAAVDMICLPTKREGFPNVVLEAAAAGLPAVTTTATGARDSVINGTTGLLVEVGRPQQLAEALSTLAVDPDLRAAMGDAARERASTDFVPQTIWAGLDALYRRGR